MKNRFKELRNKLGVTQGELADKLGLTRNFIAQIEMGNKIPSERTINDICREYGVNKDWLSKGIGNMLVPTTKYEEISRLFGDVEKSDDKDFKFRLIKALAELDENGWAFLEGFIDGISKQE